MVPRVIGLTTVNYEMYLFLSGYKKDWLLVIVYNIPSTDACQLMQLLDFCTGVDPLSFLILKGGSNLTETFLLKNVFLIKAQLV